METQNINEELKAARSEFEVKIAELHAKILALDIIEGKVSVIEEVKRRILDVAPGFQNMDYVLWPLRVMANGKIEPDKRKVAPHKRVADWSDPEMERLLLEGRHDELVQRYGITYASVRSRANKIGYAFRMNKPLRAKSDAGKGGEDEV